MMQECSRPPEPWVVESQHSSAMLFTLAARYRADTEMGSREFQPEGGCMVQVMGA